MFIIGVRGKQRIIGFIEIELKIANMTKPVIIGVCKSLRNDFVIGLDVTRKFGVVINVRKREIFILNGEIVEL